jgi:very-short-patch-repair endonuclease
MDKTARARELRRTMTDAQRRLWRHLRRHFLGVHFRRQVPIGPYIVDFACLGQRLVVEVDGGQHLASAEDKVRDRWLRERGYRVLRFWNHEVLKNTEGVLLAIASAWGTVESEQCEREPAGA